MRDEKGVIAGVEAVIDKDLSAAVLGTLVHADMLIILTDVDSAYKNFRDPEKRERIPRMTIAEAQKLLDDGEFAKGSMGPKVKAGINFVRATGNTAIISSLNKVDEAIEGKVGTMIVP